jgi:putative membrane protein
MSVTCAVALALYAAGVLRLRRRGDAWSPWRFLSFGAGACGLAAGLAAPLPGGEFTAHMLQHLIVGMYAPLLLVLGRPITLALRALRPGPRRVLLSVARSRPAAVLVFPPVAAALDVGGLWILYRTPLFAATHEHAWPHLLVHLHVFAAGLLFSVAICQVEPLRHRYSLAVRGGTLVVAGTAHAVLAKSLWVAPPPHFTAPDLHTGAEVMYYGGDLAEIALAAVVALAWYAAGGRALRRVPRAGVEPAISGLRVRRLVHLDQRGENYFNRRK